MADVNYIELFEEGLRLATSGTNDTDKGMGMQVHAILCEWTDHGTLAVAEKAFKVRTPAMSVAAAFLGATRDKKGFWIKGTSGMVMEPTKSGRLVVSYPEGTEAHHKALRKAFMDGWKAVRGNTPSLAAYKHLLKAQKKAYTFDDEDLASFLKKIRKLAEKPNGLSLRARAVFEAIM